MQAFRCYISWAKTKNAPALTDTACIWGLKLAVVSWWISPRESQWSGQGVCWTPEKQRDHRSEELGWKGPEIVWEALEQHCLKWWWGFSEHRTYLIMIQKRMAYNVFADICWWCQAMQPVEQFHTGNMMFPGLFVQLIPEHTGYSLGYSTNNK